ncbi:MAG: sensor histidine kinase [Campylobacterales bacterium]
MEIVVFHTVIGAIVMIGLYHALFFLFKYQAERVMALFAGVAFLVAALLWTGFAAGLGRELLAELAVAAFSGLLVWAVLLLRRLTHAFDRAYLQEKALARRNLRLEEKVRERTAELEMLFRELQHRVKNNLQVILGLAWLQQERAPDPATQLVLGELVGRIRAIALVHEALKSGQGNEPVEIDAYLQRLLEELAKAYNRGGLWFAYHGEGLSFSADRAVEIGLVVNEAVTNALLHAFGEEENPWVEVSLRKEGEFYHLGIVDNGPGLPQSKAGGLGMGLMEDIARRKLDGEFSVESLPEGGTRVGVIFPPLD